jgi:hypothetical protein
MWKRELFEVLKKLGSLAATSFQLCDFVCVKREKNK